MQRSAGTSFLNLPIGKGSFTSALWQLIPECTAQRIKEMLQSVLRCYKGPEEDGLIEKPGGRLGTAPPLRAEERGARNRAVAHM